MIRRNNHLWLNSNPVAIVICCLAIVFYSMLASNFPVVYWYDSHIRLALRNQILLGHWLPIIQLLIVLVSKFTDDLLVLRILLAIIAGCGLLCMYVFSRRVFSSGTALVATIFLATNMMFTALATVPYPEVLFIGLLFITLKLLDGPTSGNYFYLGILALNIACLTRYEGWLLAVVLVVEAMWNSLQTKNWKSFFQTTLLISIAPLAWLIFGISGYGNILDRLKAIIAFEIMTDTESLGSRFLAHLNLDYLKAFASNYYHLLTWQAGLGIILLGMFGWLQAVQFTEHRTIHWRILAFVILDWLLLAFWQPWNFTNLRTAFIGLVFLVLYAAHGLQQLTHLVLQWFVKVLRNGRLVDWQNWFMTALTFVVVYNSILSAIEFVKQTSQENDFSRPAQIARWIKPHLGVDDAILILTDDVFQPYALATYIGLPYDTILDDRFDSQQIYSHLVSAQFVYVIELYRERDGLSNREIDFLQRLEDGTIRTQFFPVGPNRIWRISTDELDMLKAVYN